MVQLTSLRLAGWKSIRDASIEIRPLNVLIGANGAGKSNLISFFTMMKTMMAGRLQIHLRVNGGADSLLHYGPKRTDAIEAEFRFVKDHGQAGYSFRLVPAVGNALIFEEEKLSHYPGLPSELEDSRVQSAHLESYLNVLHDLDKPKSDLDRSGEFIQRFFQECHVFHIDDTSRFASIRQECPIDSNRSLSTEQANLPAILHLYRQRYPVGYHRIVAAVRAVAPFFDDFVLEPLRLNPKNIALHWRAKGSDYEFGAHQLSDGTLRAIALFTLLLQPEADLPKFIVLDEPELGLHPSALSVLADLLKLAAQHSQLLIATQSVALVDLFEVEDVITTNLREGSSSFERLDSESLKGWLEDYTLSELWEKNVIGGGPYQ